MGSCISSQHCDHCAHCYPSMLLSDQRYLKYQIQSNYLYQQDEELSKFLFRNQLVFTVEMNKMDQLQLYQNPFCIILLPLRWSYTRSLQKILGFQKLPDEYVELLVDYGHNNVPSSDQLQRVSYYNNHYIYNPEKNYIRGAMNM